MTNIPNYKFTDDDFEEIMQYSRKALRKYTIEEQKLDIGSVSKLLNRKVGVLVELESDMPLSSVLGKSMMVDNNSLAKSIVDAITIAASKNSIGRGVNKSELDKLRIKLSIVDNVKIITEANDLQLGIDFPYTEKLNETWIYPTKPIIYNWTEEEYLIRQFDKADIQIPIDNLPGITVLQTIPLEEKEPNGKLIRKTKIGNDDIFI